MDIILFLAACGLAVLASGLARENNELRETIKQQEKMLRFLTETELKPRKTHARPVQNTAWVCAGRG